jgi:hypothetical protein
MVSLGQLQKILKRLPGHKDESVKEMLEYFMEKIIIRHFQTGNATAYNYQKLDPKYLKRKQKLYGNQPMLVASGVLRESVTTMYKIYKIRGKFRVIMRVPGYGKFVKEIRDFTIINKRDKKDLLRYYKTNLKKRRKIFVSQVTSKRI